MLCDELEAKAAAFAILSAYPKRDVNDPEGFFKHAIAVLRRYSSAVVQEVADLGSGIQTRQKFLPVPAEIREACERVAGEHANRERRRLLNEHRVLLDTPYGLMPECMVNPPRPLSLPAPSSLGPSEAVAVKSADQAAQEAAAARKEREAREARSARSRWEGDMWRALSGDWPLAEAYSDLLIKHPHLCDDASERERQTAGAGWPWVSRKLAALHVAAQAQSKEVANV